MKIETIKFLRVKLGDSLSEAKNFVAKLANVNKKSKK